MYFRQQPQLPSTTVLQVTGHLTIYHPLHHMQQRQHQHQQSLISPQHTFKDIRNKRKYDWDQQCGFKNEIKQTQLKDAQLKKSMEITGEKIYKQPYQEHKENCQKENERVSILKALREIGSRFEKMEQAWETNNGSLNFETLYQLQEIRDHLERQTVSLLFQLNQQIQPFRQENQKWKKELEMQRSLLTKERQEWKREKQQLYKQMETMIETVLEEEGKQVKRIIQNKLTQLDEHLEKDLKVKQVDLRGQVEKVEERLNLRVNKYVNEHGQREEQLELLNDKIQKLIDKVTPFLVGQREMKRQKERLEKMVDRTTPCAGNFSVQYDIIELVKQQMSQQGILSPQIIWLNLAIGEVFSCLIQINPMQRGEIMLGVSDRISQRHKRRVTWAHGITYAGIGFITYGTGKLQPLHEKKETNDCLSKGMEVLMKVDRRNCVVTFTLIDPSARSINNECIPINGTREYQVVSPILNQPMRQFSPFFVLFNKGSNVRYDILENS